MRQSQLFPKTIKQAPKDAESINHKLLVRGGFIDQLMAGSWTLLPMGWKVVDKINDIIRDELNKTGAQEMLMPLLHPKDIWNETGRWEKAKEVMYQFKDARGKEYALSFTHEEIILDLVRKHLDSYQDLPIALYHFSTKFRNEPRARSGILRGREFLMKDLYSLHATESDFWRYYNEVKEAYKKIFKRLGFDIKVTEAGGGVFTDNVTHEFQVPTEGGEDLIYFCSECDWGMNQEIFEGKEGDACPRCGGIIKKSKSIEVGNIFPFGTSYSEKMDVTFTDENGKRKPVWFGSYGIGSTRVMGAWVEVSHDEKGMIWNDKMAPFDLHLLDIKKDDKGGGEAAYNMLKEEGLDVLFDERDVSAGVKFTDADLIGIPIRLVISDKTGEKLEYKKRNEDKSKLFNKEELLKSLTN
jgi:prolyl-tRNA synthetase